VCAIAPLSDGRLASGGEDDGIHLTRLPGFAPLTSYQHGDFVRCLAALPGGQLASASYDTTVRLWRTVH
jgi:WD40 repeat protein